MLTVERATLLSAISLLVYLLSWIPGGQFEKSSTECCALARTVLDDPVTYLQDRMAAGTPTTSFVGDLFEMESGKDLASYENEFIKAVAATVLLEQKQHHSHSFSSSLLWCYVQKRRPKLKGSIAWFEIPVCPSSGIAYAEAVLLESWRWHSGLIDTLAVLPCTTTTANVFHGMYIPKGVTVLINFGSDLFFYGSTNVFNSCDQWR